LKAIGRTDRFTLLLTGFIVLVIPLWFFNSLLKTSLQRARESSLGQLREGLLQTAEQVRRAMTPAEYVKEVVQEVHREVLPRFTPDLIKMQPDLDFGKDDFDSDLPLKLLRALQKRGLDAILVHVNTPEFEESRSWYSDELARQCEEREFLDMDLTFMNYSIASNLYQQLYQRVWPRSIANFPAYVGRAFQIQRYKYTYAYLSRFSEMFGAHDRVIEVFTDYFGQQSVFCYSYCAISAVTLHGAYTVVIPQKSVRPAAILDRALADNRPGFKISSVRSGDDASGFINTSDGVDYYLKAPSEFWSHFQFAGNANLSAGKGRNASLTIRISGQYQPVIKALAAKYLLFRLASAIILIFYSAFAFHFWLFGFSLQLSSRRKLAIILGLIVILPIIGVGALTFLSLQASERVFESHLVQQTVNRVREVELLNEENLLRQMAAGLEVKRRLEADASDEKYLFKILKRPGDDLKWFTNWTAAMVEAHEDGRIDNYSGFMLAASPNRVIDSLVDKYLDSLALLKITRKSNFSRTMTLGMMENYITPEQEEAWVVHESTVQREITHSAATGKAILLVVRDTKGRYRLLYHRVLNSDEHVYRYLSRKANNDPAWFFRRGRYGDVAFAVRLYKGTDLLMFAWPVDALTSPEMIANFARALSTRDSGYSVVRSSNDFEVRAWRYKKGESAIISAVGRSNSSNFALVGLAADMLFPVLLGYAVLLLYFITSIIAEFINGPVRIINKGVDALNNENYGVMIANFSEDEFAKVTRAFNEMSNALKQREMIKRYVSGALIRQVQTASTEAISNEGRMVKIVVLASDIRGFTSISEKYSPAEVVDMLNSYFTSMEEAITLYGGTIDKYIGDAVMAVFYDDPTLENSVTRACRAAFCMRQKLAQLNAERRRQGLFPIENGIGIDSGMAISGSIGSENGRKDFTVTGKVIEQAAELEALTSQSESKILLSLNAAQEAGSNVTCRDFNATALELLHV
jgi:class 3 adenylate cyclase